MTPVHAAGSGGMDAAALGLAVPAAGAPANAVALGTGAAVDAAGAVPSVVYASTTGGARIRFAQPAAGRVSFRIYDVRGRLVRTLLDDTRPAGAASIDWDGTDDVGSRVAAGMYFYRGEVAGERFDQKLVMVK
jgi:hypothetical protein